MLFNFFIFKKKKTLGNHHLLTAVRNFHREVTAIIKNFFRKEREITAIVFVNKNFVGKSQQ